MNDVNLLLEDIEACAYFSISEALAQGYDLEDEEGARHFLRHVEGTGRQWFMVQKADPYLSFRADLDEEQLKVSLIGRFNGNGLVLREWEISLP